MIVRGGIAVLTALVVGGCSLGNKVGSTATATPSTSVSPSAVATSATKPGLATVDPATLGIVTQNLGTAREAMAQWKGTTNFDLYYLTVDFPADLSVGKAIETYTFNSPEDKDNWWNVTISQRDGTAVRTAIPKADYLVGEQLKAIDQKYWQTHVVKAFQLAESAGGAAFRAKSKTPPRVVAKLGTGSPKGWLWWVVTYQADDGSSMKVRLNPIDGQAVDELGNPLTTSSTSSGASASPGVTPTSSSSFPNNNLNNGSF